MRGYLVYEKADATVNAGFIRMLQEEAAKQHMELVLVYADEFTSHKNVVNFVWNRSRNTAVARHYEQQGIRTFNNSRTNEIANNKDLATNFVSQLGVQTVPTYQDATSIERYPVVLKTVDGHGGQEVVLCRNAVELARQLVQFEGRETIVQPFIESNAQDVRVWMLGQEVLGAVLRTGANDFKSNYTLGGSISKFALPQELLQAVASITEALNSDYIGIDFIKSIDGKFYFNEIEDPVGARSYYDLFGGDLAQKLITYIKKQI